MAFKTGVGRGIAIQPGMGAGAGVLYVSDSIGGVPKVWPRGGLVSGVKWKRRVDGEMKWGSVGEGGDGENGVRVRKDEKSHDGGGAMVEGVKNTTTTPNIFVNKK